MNDAVRILTANCFGEPVVFWLPMLLIGTILAWRVRFGSLRVVFKSRDRQLTIETNTEVKEKKDDPKLPRQ